MVCLIKETVNLTKTNILQRYIALAQRKTKTMVNKFFILVETNICFSICPWALLNDTNTNVISLFNINLWTFVTFICQRRIFLSSN